MTYKIVRSNELYELLKYARINNLGKYNMYAKDLVGKDVIRTKPSTNGDHSYSDHPIRIISAKNVIKFEYADDWHRKYMDTDQHSLGYEWNDDGWIEYE